MKKIIITISIVSLLNLIGCYYQELLNPREYNFDENEELLVTTKDSVYNINCNDYYLENDTVFGTIRTKLDEQSTLKTNVEIPVEEIETVLLALGITVGVFAIIFLISIDMDLKSV